MASQATHVVPEIFTKAFKPPRGYEYANESYMQNVLQGRKFH